MSITLASTRADLNANDHIEWPSSGTAGASFTIDSALGVTGIGVSQDTPCDGFVYFTSSTESFMTGNFGVKSYCADEMGALFTITFPTAIKAAGANFQPQSGITPFSDYTAELSCYDASSVLLGSVSVPGAGILGPNEAVFIGAISSAYDIKSITFSMGDPQAQYQMINRLSFLTQSVGGGDPHFVGFNGERYDVMGDIGKCYNLLTDYNIQVNSLFASCMYEPENTHMNAVGIKVGTKSTGIHKIFYGIDREPRLDSHSIVRNKYNTFPSGIYDADGRMVKAAVVWDGDKLLVNSGEYRITMSKVFELDEWMVECKFEISRLGILADGVLPHGLVGCTARRPARSGIMFGTQGEGVIEGNYKHYEVESIYSDAFKYNRFNTKQGYPIFGYRPNYHPARKRSMKVL